jgi:hypothetical protein
MVHTRADPILEDLIQHLLLLQLENPGHQIGSIDRLISQWQFPVT